MRLVTPQQAISWDKEVEEKYFITPLLMMENAARSIVEVIDKRYPHFNKFIILVGYGNNGGDGLATARFLHNRGKEVKVFLAKEENLPFPASTNLEIIKRLNVESHKLEELSLNYLKEVDLIVDALLGVGIKGEVKDKIKDAIELVNKANKPVLSIDIPSGLDSFYGEPKGACIKATITVSLGLAKVGAFLYPGREYCGELLVGDISLPYSLLNKREKRNYYLLDKGEISSISPNLRRQPWLHKGTAGKALLIAGSIGLTGAATLAAYAALKVGAGLVYLAIPKVINSILEEKLTEVITLPCESTSEGTLSDENKDKLLEKIVNLDALGIGPGLGRDLKVQRLILSILKELPSNIPLVVDADAIYAIGATSSLEELTSIWQNRGDNLVIFTPHLGEAANLLKLDLEELKRNRLNIVADVAEKYNIILILKGAPTIIAIPQGEVFINSTGNVALATAGTGDVLTGMITGLLARGLKPRDAARLAVFLHGLIADKIKEEKGYLVASELLNFISKVIYEVERESI